MIRIHKIWSIRIRIQVNIITKLISKHLFTLKIKLKIFKSKPKRLAPFLGSDLKNIINCEKEKKKRCLLNSGLHSIPLDPDLNESSLTGFVSGSTSLCKCIWNQYLMLYKLWDLFTYQIQTLKGLFTGMGFQEFHGRFLMVWQ